MIWREFGMALVKIGKPREAVEAYRTAIHYTPTDFDAHYKLAATLQQTGSHGRVPPGVRWRFSATCRVLRRGHTDYLARALESKGRA